MLLPPPSTFLIVTCLASDHSCLWFIYLLKYPLATLQLGNCLHYKGIYHLSTHSSLHLTVHSTSICWVPTMARPYAQCSLCGKLASTIEYQTKSVFSQKTLSQHKHAHLPCSPCKRKRKGMLFLIIGVGVGIRVLTGVYFLLTMAMLNTHELSWYTRLSSLTLTCLTCFLSYHFLLSIKTTIPNFWAFPKHSMLL